MDVGIDNGWLRIVDTLPFNVGDSTQVVLLLAPGAIAAAISLYFKSRKPA
jgi:hypothetical protein